MNEFPLPKHNSVRNVKKVNFGPLSFAEFVAYSNTNLLCSIHKFADEYSQFVWLDGFSNIPFETKGSKSNLTANVAHLYAMCKFEMYVAVEELLKTHLSTAFSSLRKAIDAALSAYILITDPEKGDLYDKGLQPFKNVRRYFDKELEKTEKGSYIFKYPKVLGLLKTHDLCSRYGSHADKATFVHRTNVKMIGDTPQALFSFYQLSEVSDDDVRDYFLFLLSTFGSVFLIFSAEFERSGLVDSDWEKRLMQFINSNTPTIPLGV